MSRLIVHKVQSAARSTERLDSFHLLVPQGSVLGPLLFASSVYFHVNAKRATFTGSLRNIQHDGSYDEDVEEHQ